MNKQLQTILKRPNALLKMGYFLSFILLSISLGTSLHGQSCDLISSNFNLGGPSHDSGFQENDALNTVATLSNGNFVVAWETRNDVDGDRHGGFFQIFSEDGTMLTDVIMPYADVNAAGTGDQGTFGPKVVALNSGFVIGWTSENGPGDTGPTDGDQQDVFYRVFNNDGSPLTGSTRLSVPDSDDDLRFILALSAGGFVILTDVNEDNIDNKDDYHFEAFDAFGVSTSGGLINITDGTHDPAFQTVDNGQCMIDLGGGKFAVTWESRDDIDGDRHGGFLRIFNIDGSPESGIITPYTDINPTGMGDQGTPGPKIICLANGNIVMAWESEQGPGDVGPSSTGPGDDNNQDIYFRIYNSNGTPVTATIKANSDNTSDTEQLNGIIELTGGNFAILYHRDENTPGNNKDDYFVRTFTSAGVPAGSSIEISAGAHTEVFCAVLDRNRGFIALNNGNFAVGWAARGGADGDDAGAYYRVFSPTGVALSPVTFPYVDINPMGTGKQSTFGLYLKALPNGFAVAWQSKGGPGDVGPSSTDMEDVYHRVIDNNGMPLCASTKTNTGNDTEEEVLLVVHPLANGNFTIVYKEQEEPGPNKDDYFVRVIGGAPLQTVCPAFGTATVSDPAICIGETFNLSVTGLQNMAMSDNNEQNYGIRFVAFADPTSNPYSGGTMLGTVPFGSLTGGGTTASLTGLSLLITDPDLFIYAILDATPGDVACIPLAQTMISISALPTVTFTAPADLCINAGVETGLGGGSPMGGVYSGNGVTDNGNGTYDFNPTTAGVGVHTITYNFSDANGCSAIAMDNLEVFSEPNVLFTAPADLCLDAGVQAGLGGGTPTGGIYSGPGVTDDGNGMSYSFDPSVVGAGMHTIVYEYSVGNTCFGNAIDELEVFALPTVSITLPDTIFVTNGMPPQNVTGGGLPVGGVYSDAFNETMDDGNGETFSFLNNFLVGDVNTITYTFTDVNGCVNAASQTIFVAEEPVGIHDLKALGIEVFPNPTSGILNILGQDIDQITVIDIHGRVLQVVSNPNTSIDLSNLVAGLYFLRLEIDGQQYSTRVVKQ